MTFEGYGNSILSSSLSYPICLSKDKIRYRYEIATFVNLIFNRLIQLLKLLSRMDTIFTCVDFVDGRQK